MRNKLLITLILGILLLQTISAVCTVTFGKESYVVGESITAAMSCDTQQEKNQAYTLNWTYQNGTSVELDTGTTPATVGQLFYQNYIIPSSWPNGVFINATLQGTNLEGTDFANVSTTGTTGSLLITNISIGGKWLGLTSSVKATVKDLGGKLVSGGECKVNVLSNDETTILSSSTTSLFNGDLRYYWNLNYESFKESTDYAVRVVCYCGTAGSSTECINQEGSSVNKSVGSAKSSFTTNSWLTLRENPMPVTYINGTDFNDAIYYGGYGEKVYYRANVTNNYPDSNLKIKNKAYLVNNNTGEIYEDVIADFPSYGISSGNSTIIVSFGVGNEVPSGVYYVRNFFDIYFNNLLVSQGIMNTETFNISGTASTFSLDSVTTDKTNYYTGQPLHICANITNNYEERVEFEIYYNYRCGSSSDNFATDRSLLGEHSELRAVSPGISQHQCAQMHIPYEDHLLYKTSQCYASVTIKSPYIPTFDNKKVMSSNQFNITDYGMYPEYELDSSYPIVRLMPDWRRFDDLIDGVSRSYFRAKLNITQLNENWLDPNGIIGDSDWDVYALFSDRMPCTTDIYNYTTLITNGSIADNSIESKALTWKNSEGEIEHKCALGIEEVNFSDTDDDYFEVRVFFEDFEERTVEALESMNTSLGGIENKTGTFHLDVNCPSQGLIGNDLNCSITAQIEDGQTVQKEVDFTCYILDGSNIYSSINFNQMVTQDSITLYREFPIPFSFIHGQQATLQCHADYYNFGSRRDSFYDTFVAVNYFYDDGGGKKISPLTGEAVVGLPDEGGALAEEDEGDGIFEEGEGPEKTGFVQFIKDKLFYLLGILFVLIFFFIVFGRRSGGNINFLRMFTIAFVIVAIIGFIFYGILFLDSNFGKSISLEDNLVRGMVIAAFACLIIAFLVRALNIQGELRFGGIREESIHTRQSKLQEKINVEILKRELHDYRNKKHSK